MELLQIVVPFLPGEPIELLAGVCYGAWGGMAFLMISVFSLIRSRNKSYRRAGGGRLDANPHLEPRHLRRDRTGLHLLLQWRWKRSRLHGRLAIWRGQQSEIRERRSRRHRRLHHLKKPRIGWLI